MGYLDKIPICIVSSKDFDFLHNKTRFASIVSCLLGIDTVALRRHKRTMLSPLSSKEGIYLLISLQNVESFECIKNSYLSIDDTRLQYNSELLSQLAEEIASRFNEISIEQKFTLAHKETLAGLTMDWRNMDDWKSFKVKSEPHIKKAKRIWAVL